MNITPGLPRSARSKEELVGLDIEIYKMQAPRLHRPTGTFACLSVAYENGDVYQVYTIKDMRRALERVSKAQWVVQNMLFDVRHLRRWTEIPQRFVWDTMVVEQDLFGGLYEGFALDHLCRRWLNKELPKEKRQLFAERESMTEGMKQYAAMDALTTVKVARHQLDYVKDNSGFMHYTGIDEPAMWAILDMPPAKINVDRWLAHARRCAKKGEKLEQQLGFNVKSWQQVVEVVSKAVGFKIDNSREDTLKYLLEDLAAGSKAYKLIEAIMEARMYRDAASKYGEDWIDQHVEAGGLVYADWKVTGADQTGRMACSDPNLQNIPVRELPVYRTFFETQFGSMIISDVKQQEPCILAHLSQDPVLLADVSTGDVYKPIATDLSISRSDAKPVFLGATYGLTKYGLAKKQRITVPQADRFMTMFFRRYRQVDVYMGNQRLMGRKQGYVSTASGRRSWLSPYNKRAINNAVNSPIQGTAADWTKLSLVTLHQLCQSNGIPFRCPMVIHDERVQDVEPKFTRKYVKLDEEAWRTAGRVLVPSVPTRVDVYLGENWGAKH